MIALGVNWKNIQADFEIYTALTMFSFKIYNFFIINNEFLYLFLTRIA